MRGQNDKVHLKNFKLFRIFPKKIKNQKFWGIQGLPSVLKWLCHYRLIENNKTFFNKMIENYKGYGSCGV